MQKDVSIHLIERIIFTIRGQRVMIDRDLAALYGVSTKRLNEQVKRNIRRFPSDFMFQLTTRQTLELVANCDRFKTMKHSTVNPYAFTEQGVAMLSTALSSERAIHVNIAIMRTFVKMRELMSNHVKLNKQLNNLKSKVAHHDKDIEIIFEAIRRLIHVEEKPKGKIGFHNQT
jgi:hypothetical protein